MAKTTMVEAVRKALAEVQGQILKTGITPTGKTHILSERALG
jgi:hypothetical protein